MFMPTKLKGLTVSCYLYQYWYYPHLFVAGWGRVWSQWLKPRSPPTKDHRCSIWTIPCGHLCFRQVRTIRESHSRKG